MPVNVIIIIIKYKEAEKAAVSCRGVAEIFTISKLQATVVKTSNNFELISVVFARSCQLLPALLYLLGGLRVLWRGGSGWFRGKPGFSGNDCCKTTFSLTNMEMVGSRVAQMTVAFITYENYLAAKGLKVDGKARNNTHSIQLLS